jgi:hypothetical protein
MATNFNLRQGAKAVLLEGFNLRSFDGDFGDFGESFPNSPMKLSELVAGEPYFHIEKMTVFLVRREMCLRSLRSLHRYFFNLRRLFSKGKIFLGYCFREGRILGTEKGICHNIVSARARALRSVHTLKVSARSITVAERSYPHMPGCIRLVGGATVWCSLKGTACVCTVGLGLSLLLLLWLTTSDHT